MAAERDSRSALLITLTRAFGTLVLGAVVFFALLGFLVSRESQGHLLEVEFYTEELREAGFYDRVYTELLSDPGFREQARRLTGGLETTTAECEALVREVLPPAYLTGQIDGALEGLVAFLAGETEDAAVYIELGPVLEGIPVAVTANVQRRIDGAAVAAASDTADFQVSLEGFLREVSAGRRVEELPGLDDGGRADAGLAWDSALASLRMEDGFPDEALQGLEEGTVEIRAYFSRGEVRLALKAAAVRVSGPVIDDTVAELGKELDAEGRLDVLGRWAGANSETRSSFLAGMEPVRDLASAGEGVNPWAMLAVLVGGVISLSLVHLPHGRQAALWPGLVLLVTGGFCLAAGAAIGSQLPGRLSSGCGDLPESLCGMADDVFEGMGATVSSGVVGPSVVVAGAGAALLAAVVAQALVGRRRSGGGARQTVAGPLEGE